MNLDLVIFECNCKRRKKFRLTCDGGSTGHYIIELCQTCRSQEDCKFLIKEEDI